MANPNPRHPSVPGCTCGNSGRCGYCPSIAATAAREGYPPVQRHGIGPCVRTTGGAR
jgi:hypothetical protein